MDIKNITGLEKPLVKLVETVSEGVGVIGNRFFEFDVAKIKRIGKAEADVEKQKIIANAEAQEKAIEILGRAEKRFALEQYSKQINLENILVKTRDDIKDRVVSGEPVEKDWAMKFMDIAQNVSREELQDVLAKILSGEIQNPGSFSYQTLDVVKYLSQKDLEKFLRFVAISSEDGVIKLTERNSKESLEKYNLVFEDYMGLSSVGLFNPSSTIRYDIEILDSKPFPLSIGRDSFLIEDDNGQNTKNFNMGLYPFSNVGKELRSLMIDKAVNEKSKEYKEDFIEKVEGKGFKVSEILN